MDAKKKEALYRQYEGWLRNRTYSAASRHMVTYAMDDLMQEASVAFCRAIDRYDPGKGKLVTYAWRAVKNRLCDVINDLMQIGTESLDEGWSVSGKIAEIPVEDPAYRMAEIDAILTDDERAMVNEALTGEHSSMASLIRRMQAHGWSFRKARRICVSIREKIA